MTVRTSHPIGSDVPAVSPTVEALVTETYLAHRDDVAAACRRRLDGDGHLADDVTQEAFARALAADAFENVEHCRRFVHVVARNLCGDRHRIAGRESLGEAAVAAAVTLTAASAADTVDPAEQVVVDFEAAQTARALDDLATRDRDLVHGRHVRELTIPMLAAEMGTTVGSTRVILSRAVARYRDAFDRRVAAAIAPLIALQRRFGAWFGMAGQGGAVTATLAVGVGVAATTAAIVLGPSLMGSDASSAAASNDDAIVTTSLPRTDATIAPDDDALATGMVDDDRSDDRDTADRPLPGGDQEITTEHGGVVISHRPPEDRGDATVGLEVSAAGVHQRIVIDVDLEAVDLEQCATVRVSDDPEVSQRCPEPGGTHQFAISPGSDG